LAREYSKFSPPGRGFPQQSFESPLLDEINRALQATGYSELRDLEAIEDQGLVILRGCVSSYYLKQLAQATAMTVAGVVELRSEVQVVSPAVHSQ
jgi:osmotically-inducible protein OsmY